MIVSGDELSGGKEILQGVGGEAEQARMGFKHLM
jgi:hypothetical protein